jgi:hypothetical protein
VLADYRFIPGVTIKDCMHLVTAIHLINPFQQMAIMTADLKEAREKLPQVLRHFPRRVGLARNASGGAHR